MTKWREMRKDHVAAVLLIAIGVAVFAIGVRYRMGTLVHMGAGYIPVVLGVIMTSVGLLLGILAKAGTPQEVAEQKLRKPPDARGVLCILLAIVAFVVLGAYGGLIPATFASVFIAALGDRHNTWRSASLLAVTMVVFGVIVFHFGLRVQLALFKWGN